MNRRNFLKSVLVGISIPSIAFSIPNNDTQNVENDLRSFDLIDDDIQFHIKRQFEEGIRCNMFEVMDQKTLECIVGFVVVPMETFLRENLITDYRITRGYIDRKVEMIVTYQRNKQTKTVHLSS